MLHFNRSGNGVQVLVVGLLFTAIAASHGWWKTAFGQPQQPLLEQNPTEQQSLIESASAPRLREILGHLTQTIGERNLRKPNKLDEAADYVKSCFEAGGYSVTRQQFAVSGYECVNLIAEVKGTTLPNEIILVGAHYDCVSGTVGANDNGSGTAALLNVAEQLKAVPQIRTIRFVAFANEEPPFFQRENAMGSWVYARDCRSRGDALKAVISLETMGYFTDEPDSQKYPALLSALYPNTGNFIAFISNIESRELLLACRNRFRKHSSVPSEVAALPAELPGVGWSDHWSFWQEGYQGIMITDTAPFRYPHYHRASDTIDKLDFVRYSHVVDGVAKIVLELANDTQE